MFKIFFFFFDFKKINKFLLLTVSKFNDREVNKINVTILRLSKTRNVQTVCNDVMYIFYARMPWKFINVTSKKTTPNRLRKLTPTDCNNANQKRVCYFPAVNLSSEFVAFTHYTYIPPTLSSFIILYL